MIKDHPPQDSRSCIHQLASHNQTLANIWQYIASHAYKLWVKHPLGNMMLKHSLHLTNPRQLWLWNKRCYIAGKSLNPSTTGTSALTKKHTDTSDMKIHLSCNHATYTLSKRYALPCLQWNACWRREWKMRKEILWQASYLHTTN